VSTGKQAPRDRAQTGSDRILFPKREMYDGHPFIPYKVRTAHPGSIPGMKVRSSTRWFDVAHSKRMHTPVPFVTSSGKFSGSTLCFWTAYPEQIVGSLTATVFGRIQRVVANRHGWKFARRCRETTFKVAAYYSVTHDDGFLDRVLGIFKKKKRRAVHNLYTYALNTMGDNIRFVINQVCLQSSWLCFRSRRVLDPNKTQRDKPLKESGSDSFSLLGEMVSESHRNIGFPKSVSQAWKVVHSYRKWAPSSLSLSGESGWSADFVGNLSEVEWDT